MKKREFHKLYIKSNFKDVIPEKVLYDHFQSSISFIKACDVLIWEKRGETPPT